ncbi:hypothetical protein Pan54_04830 [Rubinisphaera italica]|uniref:Uncharacterized protein n=1 Tax=Rubinisphaera italica TaxID=2527969 RepID=A0A5C5XBV8_9PLAN|nr:hypothetical protein Pan54_04830 [Rubinisphaera italica]
MLDEEAEIDFNLRDELFNTVSERKLYILSYGKVEHKQDLRNKFVPENPQMSENFTPPLLSGR